MRQFTGIVGFETKTTKERGDPRLLSKSEAALLSAAAGWRNDAVHAQVLDHLAVVIERMADRNERECHARDLVGAERALHQPENIALVDAGERLVQVGERVLQEFHDV